MQNRKRDLMENSSYGWSTEDYGFKVDLFENAPQIDLKIIGLRF